MLRRVLDSKRRFAIARPALLVLPLVALCDEKANHLEKVQERARVAGALCQPMSA
jgi:hypothetical protein